MPDLLPVLYTFRRCPYAMRARLAIAVSGQQVEHREVVLRNKPGELLAASPKGTVPVLVLPEGLVIEESLDIMLWALQRHDPQGWLTADGGTLHDMQALIAGNDGAFKQHLDRYKYPHRYVEEAADEATEESAGDAATLAATHRAAGAVWLDQLEQMLAQHGWLLGTQASLADMALLPFVRQFAHTDAAWFAAQPWPLLQAWLARFEASALFQGVMGKQAPWQAGAA
ncbi:MAG: glutathione S-transferase [Polaromonas sp.]